MSRYCWISLLLLLVTLLPAQAQRSWTVGPTGQPAALADALRLAQSGDTIELLPGVYRGQGGVVMQKKLILRGVGERPVLQAGKQLAEAKAILVIRDGEVLIENIEFRGARAPDLNGAGLRFEKGRLTVRRCAFLDNENGLLTANFGDAELRIEDTLFGEAARIGQNLNHLLYVGTIARVEVRGSRFHRSATGHLFKSRAASTWLGYNLFVDGPEGIASYEVDLPNAGAATLIGNVIAQGPGSENRIVLAYGAEGRRWPRNHLHLSHNSFINEKRGPAWFLRVWQDRLPADTEVLALNNLLLGGGVFGLGVKGRFEGNRVGSLGMLAAPLALDFALQRDAFWRDGAEALPAELRPDAEFQLPIGTRKLAPPATWSPGAFQR